MPVSPQWRPASEIRVPEPHLKNWLQDTGSLTERLQAHCRRFEVQVLGQERVPLTNDEIKAVGGQQTQVREVVLRGDGQPWVVARSLLPDALVNAGPFSKLGAQPLGRILFNDHRFARQPFELCRLQAPEMLSSLQCVSTQPLYGRRSLFCFQDWRIMVAEIFLPPSPAYKYWRS